MLHELPIANDIDACFAHKAAAGLPRDRARRLVALALNKRASARGFILDS